MGGYSRVKPYEDEMEWLLFTGKKSSGMGAILSNQIFRKSCKISHFEVEKTFELPNWVPIRKN